VALLAREPYRERLHPIEDALGVDLARISQLDTAGQRLAAEDGGSGRAPASSVAGSRWLSPSGGGRTGASMRRCGDRRSDQSEHQWMHRYGVPRLDGDWQVGKPAIEDGPQCGGAA